MPDLNEGGSVVVWRVGFGGGAEEASDGPGVEVYRKSAEDRVRTRLFLGGGVVFNENDNGM